jgi:flagellar hook-associated protein 1 FlgK
MGLSIALNNALTGMKVGQAGIEVVSRNVANSGTPGYHRQSVSVIDTLGINSTYARTGTITRAFDQSLQQHFTRATSESGFSSVKANFLDRLQSVLGMPGTAGSLDTMFGKFQTAMESLATSPDNYAARAEAVGQAQALATALNGLSNNVQSLRREAESKMATAVSDLNQLVGALEKVNLKLGDTGIDPTSRSNMLDQRDRLVSQISEMVDLRVDYRGDGSVSLMTRSGVGILDVKASMFEFQPAGQLSGTSQVNAASPQNGVGTLVLRTPAGITLDLVKQNVIRSGTLGALIELRDTTLVQAQDQLDEVAAALAQAMSTQQTAGAAYTTGASNGFEIDLAGIRNGNDFVLNYRQGNAQHSVKVMRVDDAAKLPMDYMDASGQRVIGLNFALGASGVASQLQSALGTGLAVSNPGGTTLRIMDDGAVGNTDINALTKRTTAAGLQSGLALSLFVDSGNADFTNALDGQGQKLGFAGRISVNSSVVADSRLMVQYTAGGSLGDDDRAVYLREQLDSMQFATTGTPRGGYRLAGSVSDVISQVINYQGSIASSAIYEADSQALTLETLTQRMDAEYGVDVDEEMARLLELQNAYAANARVISVVQELLDQLLQI